MVYAQRVSTWTIAVSSDGLTRSSRKPTWAQGGRLTLSVVHLTLRASSWRKCKYVRYFSSAKCKSHWLIVFAYSQVYRRCGASMKLVKIFFLESEVSCLRGYMKCVGRRAVPPRAVLFLWMCWCYNHRIILRVAASYPAAEDRKAPRQWRQCTPHGSLNSGLRLCTILWCLHS